MNLCLFEDDRIDGLQPLIRTRSVYQLRVGARSLLERTASYFPDARVFLHTRERLATILRRNTQLPTNELPANEGVLFLNGRLITATPELVKRLIRSAQTNEPDRVFMQGDELVAAWVSNSELFSMKSERLSLADFSRPVEEHVEGAQFIDRLWHILDHLHAALLFDLEDYLQNNPTQDDAGVSVSPHAALLNPSSIRLAPGVRIRAGALLDAHNGPIVLDEGVEIMENSIVRGPIYFGKGSTLKARSEIEGSSIGPVCKVAGEVMDVIFQSYSNKAHQGFLGHSFLSSWCNMGAGTISSNLRNDYGKISLYNEHLEAFENTNRQFLGVFMADHSKCGINSTLNTGSVIGVFCNIFGTNVIPRHIPSFSWGSPDTGFEPYRIHKALEVARRVMGRRRLELNDDEARLLTQIYNEIHEGAAI